MAFVVELFAARSDRRPVGTSTSTHTEVTRPDALLWAASVAAAEHVPHYRLYCRDGGAIFDTREL